MQTRTENLHVTNFVDLLTRIPKHLDLHFFKFSTNFQTFSKFTARNKENIKKLYIIAPRFSTKHPGTFVSFQTRPLAMV